MGVWHYVHAYGELSIKMVEQQKLGSTSGLSHLTTSISSEDSTESTEISSYDGTDPATSLLSRLNAQTPSDLAHKHSVAANLVSIIADFPSIIASFKSIISTTDEHKTIALT